MRHLSRIVLWGALFAAAGGWWLPARSSANLNSCVDVTWIVCAFTLCDEGAYYEYCEVTGGGGGGPAPVDDHVVIPMPQPLPPRQEPQTEGGRQGRRRSMIRQLQERCPESSPPTPQQRGAMLTRALDVAEDILEQRPECRIFLSSLLYQEQDAVRRDGERAQISDLYVDALSMIRRLRGLQTGFAQSGWSPTFVGWAPGYREEARVHLSDMFFGHRTPVFFCEHPFNCTDQELRAALNATQPCIEITGEAERVLTILHEIGHTTNKLTEMQHFLPGTEEIYNSGIIGLCGPF